MSSIPPHLRRHPLSLLPIHPNIQFRTRPRRYKTYTLAFTFLRHFTFEHCEEGAVGDAHEVGGGDVGAIKEVDWRRVGAPPEDFGWIPGMLVGYGLMGWLAKPELRGYDTALVVDAHKDAHGGVEDDPSCDEDAGEDERFREVDRGKE